MPGRFGIGFNVLVQVLLGVAIFLGVNYLSQRYYWRQDLSPSSSHSLSPATLTYLRKLGKEVEMTVVFVRGSALHEYLQGLTDEFRRNGKRLIKVEFLDPVRDAERTEQLKLENSLTLDQSGILIRANKRSRFIKEEELIITTPGPDKDNPRVDLRGEDALLSAIDGLMSGTDRTIYLVSGKGSRPEADFDMVLQVLTELGRQQNYNVQPLNLGVVQAIPEDASGVVLAGPRYDLSEREEGLLRNYWELKRSGLLVMLDPGSNTPRLDAFLEATGLGPTGNRVLYAETTAAGPRKQFSVEASFSREATVTRALKDATTTLSAQTQSIDLRLEDSSLKELSITLTPLMFADGRYWGEVDYLDDLPQPGPEDEAPPLVLAASAERGAVSDERLRVDSARLVVIGNAALLDSRTRLPTNQDFIASALNWMMNRERLIGPPPKRKEMYRVQLNPRQHDLVFWATALAAPALVLLIGFVVWAGRRAS